MRVIIVYDNEANPGLESGWGFSCLIETQERILFDTGDSGDKLIYNLRQLKVQPESIESLVINTEKGNIVVTGCAHPGLENIIERSRELGEIHGVLGGFHEFSKLEKLQGIRLIAPCHCTQYKQQIKDEYPDEFVEIKAGSVIEI